jgi:outer membrane protein TolC
MNKFIITLLFTIFGLAAPTEAQTLKRFTMQDVIRTAAEQSPYAIVARNKFRASYWSYRSFRANYLPAITLSGTVPNFNRSIDWNESTQTVLETNSLTNYGQLSLSQNIGLTGGSLALSSNLQQINKLGAGSSSSYISSPVSVTFSQPLFGYNSMRWDRKIQPVVYEEAKRSYINAMETLSLQAIGKFFDLALAQLNLRIAKINFSNSDTLYKIAQGRFNIGTIAQNDLLQMQLSYLSAKTSLTKAEIELENQKAKIRSFLGYNEKIELELVLPDSILSFVMDYQKVVDLAMANNPDVVNWKRRQLEASRDVAQAKGQRRSINLYATYGLDHDKTATFPAVYQDPYNDKQQVRLGINVPILDWGKGRGRVKMAQSNEELTNVQIKQEQTDFEQTVNIQVLQFNLQNEQVAIASKADTIAQFRYDVTKQRFLIGKIDVLNLNDALKEKDSSKRSYISALREYWENYYTLRQLTLYDFVQNKPLDADYEKLIE